MNQSWFWFAIFFYFNWFNRINQKPKILPVRPPIRLLKHWYDKFHLAPSYSKSRTTKKHLQIHSYIQESVLQCVKKYKAKVFLSTFAIHLYTILGKQETKIYRGPNSYYTMQKLSLRMLAGSGRRGAAAHGSILRLPGRINTAIGDTRRARSGEPKAPLCRTPRA